MELKTAIQGRYSYRGLYQPQPVPREALRALLEAGLAAPSGCNKQTASLIGVDDPALIAKLGGILAKPNFASAPAAVCVLTQPIPAIGGRLYNVQDYAAAIENVLLTATALGYVSCWVEGDVTGSDKGRQMADALGVPKDVQLVAYLPIGLPAEDRPRAAKKPFEERAWFNGYQKA